MEILAKKIKKFAISHDMTITEALNYIESQLKNLDNDKINKL